MGFRSDFEMKYVYGPVSSWRLGQSLGVDLLSQEQKQCSFNCSYCQVGKTPFYVLERKVYVPTEEVVKEVLSVKDKHIDYITFSGNGEPTLAKNLGEVIKRIKEARPETVAVLTNSSLMFREDVRKDLCLADMVQCKLDAATEKTFRVVSTQCEDITLKSVLEGILAFRKEYKGQLCLQIMFLQANIDEAEDFVELARKIEPDRIELNTPLRKCEQQPITKEQMCKIKPLFAEFENVSSAYDEKRKLSAPIDTKATEQRRGKE